MLDGGGVERKFIAVSQFSEKTACRILRKRIELERFEVVDGVSDAQSRSHGVEADGARQQPLDTLKMGLPQFAQPVEKSAGALATRLALLEQFDDEDRQLVYTDQPVVFTGR